MLPARLDAVLCEPPDELLEEALHVVVGDHLPQVDRDELRDDAVEESGLVQAGDGPLEVEAIQKYPDVPGVPVDMGQEQPVGVLRIAEHALHGEAAGVIEGPTRGRRQALLTLLLAVGTLGLVEHRLPARGQQAVQPAQHRERQDHPPVLGRLEVAAQQVGHRPDELGQMPGAVTHAVLRRLVPSMGLIIPWRWAGRPTRNTGRDMPVTVPGDLGVATVVGRPSSTVDQPTGRQSSFFFSEAATPAQTSYLQCAPHQT